MVLRKNSQETCFSSAKKFFTGIAGAEVSVPTPPAKQQLKMCPLPFAKPCSMPILLNAWAIANKNRFFPSFCHFSAIHFIDNKADLWVVHQLNFNSTDC